MNYIKHLRPTLLIAAIALGALFTPGLDSTLAQEGKAEPAPGKTQHLASPNAIPEGLSAADWAGIRAAHQVALQRSRPKTNEPTRQAALAADEIAQKLI